MATERELLDALRRADAAGDTAAAEAIARRVASLRQQSVGAPLTQGQRVQRNRYGNEANRVYSAAEGGVGDFLPGVGKAVYDTARGIGQLAGVVSEDDVAAARERDRALTQSGWGAGGEAVGFLTQLVGPGAAAKAGAGVAAGAGATRAASGANTIARAFLPTTMRGNLAQGATLGALQPTVEGESRLGNAAIGAGFSGAGYAIPGLVRGTRATLVDPLTEAGNDRIIGNTLRRFATDEDALLNPAASRVPGAQPTLAEATLDPGIATLERAAYSDPRVAGPLTQRQQQNNLARVQALEGIAGREGDLAAATAARGDATRALYDSATQNDVLIDDAFRKLMERPSLKRGLRRAEVLAAEQGVTLPKNPDVMSGQTLQYMDQALSDMIGEAHASKAYQKILKGTQDKLRGWMSAQMPDYLQAQQQYAKLSKPIDAMKIGRRILREGRSAAADPVTGVPTLRADSTLRAINDLDTTAQRATKFRNARGADILTPEQMGVLEGVSDSLSRKQYAQTAGKAVGSNTMQNLYSQNLMSSFGLPDALSSLGPIGRIGNVLDSGMRVAGVPERLQARLVDVLANPAEAQKVLARLPKKDREILQRAISAQLTQAGYRTGTN